MVSIYPYVKSQLLSLVAVLAFCMGTQNIWEFLLFHILAQFGRVDMFLFQPWSMWIVISQCGFDFHSLVTNAIEHYLFLGLFFSFIDLWWSAYLDLFYFFNWLLWLFLLSFSFQSSLCILEICTLSGIWLANIFSVSVFS